MPLKVRVRNYQSIEDGTITIDGLTSLTGTNNAGKSAMFRAIRGAFTNTRGHAFVRLGTSHSTVDIEDLNDGRTLTWEKGPKVNRYIINGKVFDRVGHGVPPEVAAFGVTPISAGGQDLWPQIAPQMNGVIFLLDQPGSVIAESVADVERVNQLNGALKMSESERKAAKNDLKIRLKDGVAFKERRETFDGLDEALTTLVDLDARRDKAQKVSTAHKNLVRLGEQYTAAKTAVEALEGLDDVEKRLPSEQRVEKAKAFRHAIGLTVDLAVRYEDAQRDHEVAQAAQDAVNKVALDEKLAEDAIRVKEALKRTRGLRDRLVAARGLVSNLGLDVEKREREFEEVVASATTLLGSYQDCPTCDRRMDHVH